MKFWMTQSLLNSWSFLQRADDTYADSALEGFLKALRREKDPPTQAILDGRYFEELVNDIVAGRSTQPPAHRRMTQDVLTRWGKAAARVAASCAGGQPQVPMTGEMTVDGMDLVLYGIADYVKAGTIIDIKKTSRYEYGKFQGSPQHSMYFQLLPGAGKFTYIVFDGTDLYRETCRRCDTEPVEDIIRRFFRWLNETGLMDEYKAHWAMNETRENLVADVYKEGAC